MDNFSFRRYLKLLQIHALLDLGSLLRDTKFMILAVISDICADISAMSGIFMLAWRFNGLGGLDRYEVLFILSYACLVNGVIMLLDHGNASFPSRIIGRGQWEHMFIMPVPYTVQMLSGFFPFTCSGRFFSGLFMMIFSVVNLGYNLPWWWIIILIVNIILSTIIVVGLAYLISTLAFYAPVQCEEISSTLRYNVEYIATFPLSGMPSYVKYPLLTIYPVGMVAWFPSLIILGKIPSFNTLFLLSIALLTVFIAGFCFRKGFRYYVRTGINRYSAGGHRS